MKRDSPLNVFCNVFRIQLYNLYDKIVFATLGKFDVGRKGKFEENFMIAEREKKNTKPGYEKDIPQE